MKRLRNVFVICIALVLFVGSAFNVSAAEIKDIFDADYYVEKYADLKAAFGDNEDALYQHYITYGIKEGRIASEVFDVQNYRSKYADLEAAFGDDWSSYVDHYLTHGLSEGRDGGGEFDAVSYADRYPDLYNAFGYNVEALYNHYQEYGIKEGRNSQSEMVEQWVQEAEDESDEDESDEDEPKVEEPKEDESNGDESKEDTPTDNPGYDTTQAYIQQVVDRVNKEREAAGLAPLEMDDRLQEAAAVRAGELKESFSHSRPDGALCFTVLNDYDIRQTAVGENIARYYPTPEEAMDAWMESQGHKENILDEKYTHIGVGYYVSESGMPYWVQLFIRKPNN